jgi:hypothetical protein
MVKAESGKGEAAKAAPKASTAIKVDQVGYPVDGPKVALISFSAGGPVAPGSPRNRSSFERPATMQWCGKGSSGLQ